MSHEIAITIITAIVGVLGGGGVVAWINRKKTNAEADGLHISGHMEIVDRTLDWNKQLLEERDKLIKRIEAIEKNFDARFEKMEKEIEALENENKSLRLRCRKLEEEKEQMKSLIDEELLDEGRNKK